MTTDQPTQRNDDPAESVQAAEARLEDMLGDAGAEPVTVEPDKSIHVALSDVMREMPAIAKTQKNQQQGFNYRGIDDICNAASPLFKKHGITLSAEVIGDVKREERQTKTGGKLFYSIFTMEYTFWARDGSSRKTQAVGEGMDSGDKSSNKAMSVAMKYAILQMLCIPTAMVDPDGNAPPAHPNPTPNRNAPKAMPRGERSDVSRQELVGLLNMWLDRFKGAKSSEFNQWFCDTAGKRYDLGKPDTIPRSAVTACLTKIEETT